MSEEAAVRHQVGDGCMSGDTRRVVVMTHVRSLTNADLVGELRRAWALRFEVRSWGLADLWLLIDSWDELERRGFVLDVVDDFATVTAPLEVRSPAGVRVL